MILLIVINSLNYNKTAAEKSTAVEVNQNFSIQNSSYRILIFTIFQNMENGKNTL